MKWKKLFLVQTSLFRKFWKVTFVTTYQPNVKELRKLIRDLLPLFYIEEEVQNVFPPPRMVFYVSARKIKH